MLLQQKIYPRHRVTPHKQSGAALLALMLVIIAGASYMLVSNLNANTRFYNRQIETSVVLSEAKAALIAYALTYPENVNPNEGPGYLPCPDRTNPESIDQTFVGRAGTSCSLVGGTTVGRFPWKTLRTNDLRDHAGERLWYAVSENFKNNPKVMGYLNSDTPGSLLVDTVDDIIAVIFAPGAPVANQDRDRSNSTKLLDPANYLEGGNEVINNKYVSRFFGEFNDQLVFITRKELMEVVEQRIVNQVRTILANYYDTYGVYPWLSPFANPQSGNPQITGTTTGGSGLVLEDDLQDFITAGIRIGDLVINNGTAGSVGRVKSIDGPTRLTLDRLDFGNSNSFSSGNDYSIPRFNGTIGAREGLLPFHVDNEAFTTRFIPDWFANNATINVDTSVTPANHVSGISNAISTSEGTISDQISVVENTGVCIWTAEEVADCKGIYTDNRFISGKVTSNSGPPIISNCFSSEPLPPNSSPPDNTGCLILNDIDKNFPFTGIARGDIILNYSAPVGIPINGIAAEGSNGTILIDSSRNFNSLGVVPRSFLVNVMSDIDASESTYIVESVVGSTLTLIPLPDQEPILSENFEYSVYAVKKGIVDSDATEASELSIKTVDGAEDLRFIEGDNYSILVAANRFPVSGNQAADTHTNIAEFVVYESSIPNFVGVGVKAGDAVENFTHGGIGLVTATGVHPTSGAWFTYTALKGGIYPDIFQGERYRIHHTHIAERRYEVSMNYAGIVPNLPLSSSDKSKRRSVCIGYGDDCVSQAPTLPLPRGSYDFSVDIRDYSVNGNLIGQADISLNSSTTGRLRAVDIQYDLIESEVELPIWFVKNDWHKLTYISYPGGMAPGSSGICTPGTGGDCLQLQGTINSDKIEAVVIVAGKQLDNAEVCPGISPEERLQNRDNGRLCDYFENENAVAGNDVFRRDRSSALFNDKVIIISPSTF
jgi:type II secretory pathway pseudopilin PulG